MGKLEQIEKAIEELSVKERAKLSAWLDELQERAFDEAIVRDAKAGKFDKKLAEVEANYRAGRREKL